LNVNPPVACGRRILIVDGKHDAPVRSLYDLSRISLIFAASTFSPSVRLKKSDMPAIN